MDRQQAYYEGSRLYSQARDGYKYLYENLDPTQILNDLHKKEISDFENSNEIKLILDKLKKDTSTLAETISVYHSLPILIETVTQCYYSGPNKLKTMGMGIKMAISLIWKNEINNNVFSESKSLKDIKKLVSNCFQIERLETLLHVYMLYEDTKRDAEVTDSNIYKFMGNFKKKSIMKFRTVGFSVEVFLENYSEALFSVMRVINGAEPKDISLFSNTIFCEIPSNNINFWSGLWARLMLLVVSSQVRERIGLDNMGVCIFGEVPINTSFSARKKKIIDKEIENCFWTKSWYEKSSGRDLSGLIVDRPVLRISDKLFISSSTAIVDSISWYIETTIMNEQYPYSPGKKIIDKNGKKIDLFKKFISGAFENEISDMLDKFGFLSGNVSDKGLWKTPKGDIKLYNDHASLPGEIDVLAYHKEKKLLLVIECKVLSFIMDYNRLKNMLSKTGASDSEKFHRKLSKKITWVESTNYFKYEIHKEGIVGVICLDHDFPLLGDGEFIVLHKGVLAKFLEDFFSDDY
ncbi:hypothetical protein QVE09_28295 [Paenibacillus sp. ClWae2A]|uniref:hypothetical protein n=1 Tax=Paenibacillus sp. ClWae2A TaxID=3057177 RepID=UPI0028F5C644|nr:hypothetical protein [Paenibacillus sp. ClWae2A]MDT9722800.1 hypothetical protein [Paenibacillus sp. ClWae2A]